MHVRHSDRITLRALALATLTVVSPLVYGCDTAIDGPEAPDAAAPDEVEAGEEYVRARGCPACHDPGDHSLSGRETPLPGTSVYPANLTPDPDTGLGDWSDAQIASAIRGGVDDALAPLCPPMPHFSDVSIAEMRAITAYLRALPPIYKEVPESSCPPLKGDSPGDAGAPGGDLGEAFIADLASPPTSDDAGVTPITAPDGGAEDGGPIDVPADCRVAINEIQTAGALGASDEFVELYNPCPAAIDLAGARLVYRSASGRTDVLLADLRAPLAPGGFLVAGGAHFSGRADVAFGGGGLAASGGGVALRAAGGAPIDSVGWGSAANAFVRGRPAPAPAAGQSIARVPDGAGSDRNDADFRPSAPTPGTANH